MSKEITAEMLLEMIQKTGWDIGANTSYLVSLDKEATILNQQKQISDLEAKLAEVKNSCDYYMKRSNDLVCEIGEYKKHIRFKGKEITELKQQLAEKELVLDKILTEIHTNCYSGLNIVKFKEMVLNDLGSIAINHNQDKISFAVERLVNVQKYISDNAVYVEEESFGREINDFIDNQIKQLKEMK